MIEKQNLQISAILTLYDLWRPNRSPEVKSENIYERSVKGLSNAFFRALLTLIVHELRRHLSGNVGLSRTAVKLDLW